MKNFLQKSSKKKANKGNFSTSADAESFLDPTATPVTKYKNRRQLFNQKAVNAIEEQEQSNYFTENANAYHETTRINTNTHRQEAEESHYFNN